MRCEVAVDIDSCPEYVWAVLTDVSRWPAWTTAVREVSLSGGGSFGPGSVLRIRSARLPDRVWRVTAFAPNRGFTWTGEGLGSRAGVKFRLEAGRSTGTTRLTITHDRSGWIAGGVQRVTAGTVGRHLDALAGGLKERCEQRRPALRR